MEPVKRKRLKYNVLFVPDVATADIKRFNLSLNAVSVIIVMFVFVLLAVSGYCYYLTRHGDVTNEFVSSLQMEIDSLKEENKILASENDELQRKVSILSDTVNEKVQQEEKREAEEAKVYIPTGFPLNGSASYDEDEANQKEEPTAEFVAAVGTSVIATAMGKVSAIAGDDENGYTVIVDHGNGYYSVYKNGTAPKVAEGDKVTVDTALFEIEQSHETLSYQIIYNGEYIDPFTMIEIAG